MTAPPFLADVAHRPWPLPDGAWVMAQTWHDVLFMHWKIDPAQVRPHIPPPLELHLHDGDCWIGVVPFRMSGVRLRGTPAVPWFSKFPELNVRVYVIAGDRPGVWFLSLDAANPLAVQIARRWFHLPYQRAEMSCERRGDGFVYRSKRLGGAPPAVFRGRYAPTGPVSLAAPGTLDHWLTERYCLYAADAEGDVYRGEIHHMAWPLQPVRAEIEKNTMTVGHGIALPDEAPLLHFASSIDVVAWAPVAV